MRGAACVRMPLVSAGATTVTTTPSLAASATVWMRTWNAGTTTWTWQGSKTTHPALEPVSRPGPDRGEGREASRPWLFEAPSRATHYCGTCFEPLGGTTCTLPEQTSGLRRAQYVKCSRQKLIFRISCCEILVFS